MEDWSLQAMIGAKDEDDHDDQNYYYGSFGPIDIKKEYDQALLFSFPHLLDENHALNPNTKDEAAGVVVGNELDQLYKPFYPVFDTTTAEFPPPPPANDLQAIHHQDSFPLQEIKREQEQQEANYAFCGSSSASTNLSGPLLHAPKLKKRKNQQKRVVVQVTADGLSSDLWAWRKYGQKPIKGSPYPRSYYRCSSSKGCLARRQVEQSCTDPGIYLLTYTAEHNHPQPTRRNSLAGVNRNKFRTTTPKSPTKSKDSSVCSPATTPSFSSIDEEVMQQPNPIKQEQTACNVFGNQEVIRMMGDMDDDFVIPDMSFCDDFFAGLEDLGGLNPDLSCSYSCSNKQFPASFVNVKDSYT